MPLVIKRQDKDKPKKSNEKRIEELEAQLVEKDKLIATLQEQVESVQLAVDDIILGGML